MNDFSVTHKNKSNIHKYNVEWKNPATEESMAY